MKETLSKRLFIITSIFLVSFMALTLIFQTFIFEDFYERKKTKALTNEIEQFSLENSFQISNPTKLYSALKNFEDTNNSKIAIFSVDGKLRYISSDLQNDKDDIEMLTEFCSSLLDSKDILLKLFTNNKPISTTFYTNNHTDKNIGVAAPMSINSKNDSIVLSVSSIQPIIEASNVISEFYVYIFIGILFICLIISSIFSSLVTHPLKNINHVATKMSKMDFSEKCETNRDDEIGNLAKTLNFLSTNLQSSLDDLKEKNKKLEQDIEKERKLETMRKDFVASVSHELKTPIGIIEGYAEGIKDGIVSGHDELVYLETIIDESQKMSKLVSNMLELSKLESGVIKPHFEVFNINRLINKVVNKLTPDSKERNLNMKFIPKTDYSYINADIFKMEQVLTNVITNAIKYTPENNNIIVSIDTVNEDYFRISVLNTGTSIPDGENINLFNKFYRLDKSGSRRNNSTGLGLAIVKNILDLHHFTYDLRNVPKGVLFEFFLKKAQIDDVGEDI
ncbi:HAMP domain-containing histidine kinase [Clostridium sardiniense]|uniref:histidine kinase n=1 Tax=Clostridium sardiniense TaxID=29369 RepID=A0ABS7KVU7_CLOSR|nr:HAMP domain-containing sensor histidine kinase [Clostridium sardiniense]MBY0754930.1 HAMP domain-containing histidine kinase [Clostridium sardiniense]MDQ0461867.1 signal transduction histidine kinase [Clostridium sardiniense]